MNKLKIQQIDEKGILAEMGVAAGDYLISISGQPVRDSLDYRFLSVDEALTVVIEKPNGEIWELDIEKEDDEDLGITLEDEAIVTKTCRNHCVFCFIDQMPTGMRESLYIKDDDERLSFLTGNYITLTNLSEADIKRIIQYHIMPINVSIHTTCPELRQKMLGNRHAGDSLATLERFYEAKIAMNGQIVLVPGYNDGEVLDQTLLDMMNYYPAMQSLSVVPVGLTKHRERLAKIDPVSTDNAKAILQSIAKVQTKMQKEYAVNFVYPSDEIFLLAGETIPKADYYDGFPQIENGVGMMASFADELDQALENNEHENLNREKTGIITGFLAKDFLSFCVEKIKSQYPGGEIEVYPIENQFFGDKITVSGLITAADIIAQIPKDHGCRRFLIPENMLRSGTEDFLDDITLSELAQQLGAEVKRVPVSGAMFLRALSDTDE